MTGTLENIYHEDTGQRLKKQFLNLVAINEEEISETFTWLVPKIMAKHNMNEIIAVAAEYRCFEDFDYRKSRQKIDFYRKWYHTRAKISIESLDEIKEKYAENTDGME